MVRPAIPSDVDAIAAIYAHYVAETVMTFDLEPPPVEEWRRRHEAAAEARHPWFVAADGDRVDGFFTSGPFRSKAAYAPTVECTIYLRPGSERRGLGTALYTAALAELGDRGFHRAVAGITLPNPASVALHERLGFTPVGVFEEVGHKHGAFRSVAWWQRPL